MSWIIYVLVILAVVFYSMQSAIFALLYSQTLAAYGEDSLESLQRKVTHCAVGLLVKHINNIILLSA